MLDPNQYAVGNSGSSKFVAQPHRCNSAIQISRSFAEMVQGRQIQVKDRKHPEQLSISDKGKTWLGEERMVVPDLEQARVAVSGVLMDKPCPIAAGGGLVKSWSVNVAINLGETLLVGNK